MIIFRGYMSKKCREYCLKKVRTFICLWGGIYFILLAIPICIGGMFNKYVYLLLIFALFVAVLTIVVGLQSIDKTCWDSYIFEDEKMIRMTRERMLEKDITDIKSIIDMGDFYEIIFYFPGVLDCIIQKDLIVEGSIEEFEERFADYIVRKPLKNRS